MARRVERGEKFDHSRVVFKVHRLTRRTQHDQREEHEGGAEEEVAHIAVLFLVDEHDAEQERRIDDIGQVNVVAQRHDPRRERCAYVGTHDDRDGLRQRQQSCRHERHGHHRRCRR